MKITKFRIENFRNIRLAECDAPPDFVVICGGNGCGKSALLQALMTAKEHASPYGGNFRFDPRAVSVDADKATISLSLSFSDRERNFVKTQFQTDCPQEDEIVIHIQKGGAARAVKRSAPTKNLLGWYSTQILNSPGFFDYIEECRSMRRQDLSTWDSASLSDDHTKRALSSMGTEKFQFTKQYLAGLKMRDLRAVQSSSLDGTPAPDDSLQPIREFFNHFFAPMRFVDVLIHTSPFQFIIETPRGRIDIDDMSAGEKEVFNNFIHFHQLNPNGAVILFDEADAHLHPDLERRYLEVLRDIAKKGNQLWVTTHSPEMMIAAGAESLYTILKEPPPGGGNQFVRVSGTDQLHEVLSEVMGSRGLVSFNQRIVFIEGDESSADREVYERLYPPGHYNVTFVPAGNSATVRKTAERINQLLSASVTFQQYYSIVDRDIDRSMPPPAGNRLFQLPVYHVENLLLEPEVILQVTRDMLGVACPYQSAIEVEQALRQIVLEPLHVEQFARAVLDARLAVLAKQAHDSVFSNAAPPALAPETFDQVKTEAENSLETAVADGSWRQRCKGRAVLKGYCRRHALTYEHFRNCVIAKMTEPPPELAIIMNEILGLAGTGV